NIAAGRAVGDAVLDLAHRVGQPLDFFTRRLQYVEGQPLRTLGANPGEALKLFDEFRKGIGTRHQNMPGIFRPPIMPPIIFCISSSAFRWASLMAARIRS